VLFVVLELFVVLYNRGMCNISYARVLFLYTKKKVIVILFDVLVALIGEYGTSDQKEHESLQAPIMCVISLLLLLIRSCILQLNYLTKGLLIYVFQSGKYQQNHFIVSMSRESPHHRQCPTEL